MSVIGKLVGIGVVAATAAAAVKIAQKYGDDKDAPAAGPADADASAGEAAQAENTEPLSSEDAVEPSEPEQPSEDAGEPVEFWEREDSAPRAQGDASDDRPGTVLDEVARAAGDALSEAQHAVKGAAEKAGVNTGEVADAFSEAGRAIADAGRAVANAGGAVARKVAGQAPGVLEKVKRTAGEAFSHVKDTVYAVTETQPDEDDVPPSAPAQPADDTQASAPAEPTAPAAPAEPAPAPAADEPDDDSTAARPM